MLGSTWRLGYSILGNIDDLSNSIDLSINAKYAQLKFHNNGYDQPVEISDVELYFQKLGAGRQ